MESFSSVNASMAKWELERINRAAAAKILQQQNPHLVPVSEKVNSLVAAGKNIRIELSAAFPGVKFSVRSSRFSGGDSLRVSWIDGPTDEQVSAIANKYAAGSFDCMTDCYNYEHSTWTDAFGDAKYVQTTREYSDAFIVRVLDRVSRYWGADPAPTLEDYRMGRLWKVKSNASDFQREVHRALYRHTQCVTKG